MMVCINILNQTPFEEYTNKSNQKWTKDN